MQSIIQIYRVGHGPSSSRTMGPSRAAERFLSRHQDAMARGLEVEGRLPGTLNLARKAAGYLVRARGSGQYLGETGRVFAYALAASEENAAGGQVVTAPTCGSCGVVPAVLRFLQEEHGITERRILRALATAGLEGYVQIPCIERNAVGASRALQCASFAILSDGRHRISFDEVVQTMMETGADMQASYKETSRSGLAKNWQNSENRSRGGS